MSKVRSWLDQDKTIEGWKKAVQVTLVSSDGKQIEVDKSVATMSSMIRGMIETGCDNTTIPLPNIDGKTLELVFEFCKKHNNQACEESELEAFDSKFFDVDQSVLYDLLTAAHFLDVRELMDAVVISVVDLVKGKTPMEIRKILGIKNDFTKEEEEELRKAYPWAYE